MTDAADHGGHADDVDGTEVAEEIGELVGDGIVHGGDEGANLHAEGVVGRGDGGVG